MIFCNCNFHFFRGSYYDYYAGKEEGIVRLYVDYDEYNKIEMNRWKWRLMILNRMT